MPLSGTIGQTDGMNGAHPSLNSVPCDSGSDRRSGDRRRQSYPDALHLNAQLKKRSLRMTLKSLSLSLFTCALLLASVTVRANDEDPQEQLTRAAATENSSGWIFGAGQIGRAHV